MFRGGAEKRRSRRGSVGLGALCVAVTLSVLSVPALAGWAKDVIPLPDPLWVTVDPDFSPQALSRTDRVPISLSVATTIRARGGVIPPALEELVFEFDRNIRIDGRALPKCEGPSLQIWRSLAEIKRLCGRAIVGAGRAGAGIAFPGQPPVPAALDVVVFNGSAGKSGTTLHAVGEMTDPLSAVIVMPIEMRKSRKGTEAILTVPKIAGGAGFLLDLELTLRRRLGGRNAMDGVASLRCPDGTFALKMRARFADGAQVRGEFLRKCRAKA